MKNLGFIGARGMVGSVLMNRMSEEQDWRLVSTTFFSTSQKGDKAPAVQNCDDTLSDAKDISALKKMDIIISCQGGDYTKEIFPSLRAGGWKGIWIDAASALRMEKDSVIILDPVNDALIRSALRAGKKDFIGGNCTVSLLLMALHGLFKADLIEWVSSMTYQAASGAGAKNMKELVAQMGHLAHDTQSLLSDQAEIQLLDQKIASMIRRKDLPCKEFGHALAANLLPWIDVEMPNGQSREEWKGMQEANKILGRSQMIAIDGTCVRVSAMRCHSQGITIKLKKAVPIGEVEAMIKGANQWVKLIPNNKAASLESLTPAAVTGKLDIAIGRIRPMMMGADFINAFTVGDQLLWGAAEPLRRMLRIVLEK